MLRDLSGVHRPHLSLAIVATAVVIISPAAAHAMRVSPMVVEMTTAGTGAVARVEVQNLNTVNLPYETRITEIHFDDKGAMTETPADDQFLVFPPQGVLAPGARQVVRVQWVGDPKLAVSKAFYLSVNELPVQLGPAAKDTLAAQVQVVYHMKALVTVAPPKAAPKVEIVSAKPVTITAKPSVAGMPTPPDVGKPGVEVVVRNTGNRYAMMSGEPWTISGTGADGKPLKVVLSVDDLNRDIGVGYLAPANGLRTFQVPTGAAFRPASIKVTFGK